MTHHTPSCWFAGAVILAACTSAGSPSDAARPQPGELVLTDAMRAEIETYAAAALARYQVPGAALAIVIGRRTVYTQGFGVRGLDDGRPVSPDTLFMIGSITKSMTGLMTATLVDDGLLDWDARVVDVVPGFALADPASTPLVRIRDLLSNSSGVASHDPALVVQHFSPLELVQSLAGIPVLAAPGVEFHYANHAFAAGGYAAALASGAEYTDLDLAGTYTALMSTRVFDRIGMPATTLDFDTAVGNPDHALPHAFDPGLAHMSRLPLDLERFALSVAPAGAVWSNATDMARYAITAMGGVSPDGNRVVSPQSLMATQTSRVAIQAGVGYGFGWGVFAPAAYRGRRALMHAGGTHGFVSDIALLPDDQIGIVVLANHALADGFTRSVREHVVEVLLGLDPTSDEAAVAALHATEQALIELESSAARPGADQVAGLLGRYGQRAQVSFDATSGFQLVTDFGAFPLGALPGGDRAFVSTGVTVGIGATFTSDPDAGQRLTIGGLSADPTIFPLTLPRQP
jgi:CubicO group peptidase (beta-lactamase class C family)